MRATILPKTIILTKACKAAVSIMAKGFIVASEVFRNFTSQPSFRFFFYLYYLVTSLKYSFLNTPKWQYFMLLTSGG